ncbi:hypothetical protein D6829_00615 [Candidatus Pacearchaeota archaeon]|nr:MAG: hypothetical protein D6829_00615 [Candidatus Pacearchaeota archaeon]
MNIATKKGFGFGLTSGIITTIGVMVGLAEGTGLKIAVVGGILTVAVADAFSDAFGMHISEETNKMKKYPSIWKTSLATFFTKLIVALSFLVPILFFKLSLGVLLGIIWATILLIIFNFQLAVSRKENPYKFVAIHIVMTAVVVLTSYLIGKFVSAYFS